MWLRIRPVKMTDILTYSVHLPSLWCYTSLYTRTPALGIACLCTHRKHHHSPVSPGPRSGLELHCVSKKVPTFKLSVTLSHLNRFSKLLHCWKAYEICYKTHMTLLTWVGGNFFETQFRYIPDAVS